MSAPIIITVPKFIPISPGPVHKVLEPVKSKTLDECDASKGRKRRLDHLSWEEKIQRKKLKNRVAAQTSRDRKKAKMDEMEITIKALSQQTEILQNKCDSLQAINESLSDKNRDLEKQMEQLRNQVKELQDKSNQNGTTTPANVADIVGSESSVINRSAVSNYPLPKGLESESTKYSHKDRTVALWRIIALCLLYKSCSKISTQGGLKNLPKAYLQISPETWRTTLQKAAMSLPKIQAVQSDCLDQWWGPQQNSWNPAKIAIHA
uniref:X-box-binding protein 1 n=1 Tax=Tabanus bromius TaxID=304241 RepID=A0A0K8TQ40_TABBR